MKYIKPFLLIVLIVVVSGCSSRKLKDCRLENQRLSSDLAAVQKSLADETAKHKADVERLNAESAQMQTTAMKSMTEMLKKDQEVQEKLKAQIAELESKLKTQAAANEKLSAELAELKKPAPVAPAAPSAPAIK